MKNLRKNLFLSAVFALLTAAPLLAANDVPSIKITPAAFTKKFSVVIDNLAGTAKVQLRTRGGEMLTEELVSKGGVFAKSFNLEQLPAGRYELVILTETRETIQPITITLAGIEVDAEERQEIYAPAIVVKAESVDLNLFNNRIGDVEVNIIDDAGNVVHTDRHENIFKLERRYNTAQLLAGDYIISVSSSGRTYYRSFSVVR